MKKPITHYDKLGLCMLIIIIILVLGSVISPMIGKHILFSTIINKAQDPKINDPPYACSGTPVGSILPGYYWGFTIGNYTPYRNAPLPPGNYNIVFNNPVAFYLIISPQPFNLSKCSGICNLSLVDAATFISISNNMHFTLNVPEYVMVLVSTTSTPNLSFTITRNGEPLRVTAVNNAPNETNACGYNGYPIGIQGCGSIYTVLWLTNGTNLFYIASIKCTGFGTPTQGESNIPLGLSNTCDGAYVNASIIIRTYNITFIESGLPTGTRWSIVFNGIMGNSTTNTITFNAPLGTYYYSVVPIPGYSATPSSGIVNINNNSNITIIFTPIIRTVVFIETGLPPGTTWSVTFNSTTKSSSSNTINFTVPIGTYSYTISPISGYNATPLSGTVTINNTIITISITFTPLTYSVTFNESGLPSDTTWGITINGTSYYTNNTAISINLKSGAYNYSVIVPSGYFASQNHGIINLTGNETITIVFTGTAHTISTINMVTITIIAVMIAVIIIIVVLILRRR